MRPEYDFSEGVRGPVHTCDTPGPENEFLHGAGCGCKCGSCRRAKEADDVDDLRERLAEAEKARDTYFDALRDSEAELLLTSERLAEAVRLLEKPHFHHDYRNDTLPCHPGCAVAAFLAKEKEKG